MGTGANERVAFLIETKGDLTGVDNVRSGTTALGREAKQAGEDAAAGFTKTTASVEQVREAMQRANGDFAQFKKELERIVGLNQEVARTAAVAAKATTQYSSPIGPQFATSSGGMQLGPAGGFSGAIGPQFGPALPTTRLAEEAARSAAAMDQVSTKVRTAASGIGILSQAALNGTGSMAGLANAAGGVAYGIAAVSTNAKVAASAAGIGALVTVALLAVEALAKMNKEAKTSQAELDHISNFATKVLPGARAELATVEARVTQLQAKAAEAARRDLTLGQFVPGTVAQRAAQELQVALDLRNTMAKRVRDLEQVDREETRNRNLKAISIEADAQVTATGRYRARLREIEAERIRAIQTREVTEEAANRRAADQRHDLDKEGRDFRLQLDSDRAIAEVAVNEEVFVTRRKQEDERYAAEKRALQDRTLSTAEYTKALADIEARHQAINALIENQARLTHVNAMIDVGLGADTENGGLVRRHAARLDQIEEEMQAEIRAGVDVVTAAEHAEEKKRKLYRDTWKQAADDAKVLTGVLLESNSKGVKAVGWFAENIRRFLIGAEAARAAVRAAVEGGEAIASLATGDFRGAALHGAAALELAKAAALGAQESLGGGGNNTGGSGGGAGSGTTFQARDANGGGSQVIVFQMVNPASGEILSETAYQLGRGNILKRPIVPGNLSGLVVASQAA